MSRLDCLTPKGSQKIKEQNIIADKFADFYGLEQTQPYSDSAILDVMFLNRGIIHAVAEIKSRNMGIEKLNNYGSLLISKNKIDAGLEISRIFGISFLVIAGLNDYIVYWRVGRNGQLEDWVSFATAITTTSINNPTPKMDDCAYLPTKHLTKIGAMV